MEIGNPIFQINHDAVLLQLEEGAEPGLGRRQEEEAQPGAHQGGRGPRGDLGDRGRVGRRRIRQGPQSQAPRAGGRVRRRQDLRPRVGGRADRLHGGDRHPGRGQPQKRDPALRGLLLPEQAMGKTDIQLKNTKFSHSGSYLYHRKLCLDPPCPHMTHGGSMSC